MYLNKKQLDELLHHVILLAWTEGRTWYDKTFTTLETRQLENRIKSFALSRIKK